MSILGVYAEDCDWYGYGVSVDTNTAHFRSGYARCGMYCQNASARTYPLATPVTSCWLGMYLYWGYCNSNFRLMGFGNSANGSSLAGIWLGYTNATPTKFTIYKNDNATQTVLAQEAGTTMGQNTFHRLDVQIVNYGPSCTINAYIDNTLVISWTGDPRVTGVTNFDQLMMQGFFTSGAGPSYFSEIVWSTEDTRNWTVLTMAPNGSGTTDQWTGLPANLAVVSTYPGIVDPGTNYTNTAGQDQQMNLIDPPATALYSIKALVTSVRASCSTGATATKIKIGFNSGGSAAFNAAPIPTNVNSPVTIQQIDTINPVTGVPWAYSDLTTLQLDLQSAA